MKLRQARLYLVLRERQVIQGRRLSSMRASVQSPRELYDHLSQYVVGQDQPKKTLSVAVYNHYQRVKPRLERPPPVQPDPPIPSAGPSRPGPSRDRDPSDYRTTYYDPTLASSRSMDQDPTITHELTSRSRERDWARGDHFFTSGTLLNKDIKRSQVADEDAIPYAHGFGKRSYRDREDEFDRRSRNRLSESSFDASRKMKMRAPNVEEVPPASPVTPPVAQAQTDTGDSARDADMKDKGIEIEKSNVLMIGPTGTGKTLLTKTLARFLDVPFASCDATTYTSAGYVGDDVESCVLRLLQAADYDVARAEVGIIHIDEIDKLARRSAGDGFATWGGGRDVGGEGVQQAFLRLLEGTMVTVSAKHPQISSSGLPPGPSRDPLGEMDQNRPQNQKKGVRDGLPGFGSSSKGETFIVDTTNILFICSGAFVGLDHLVTSRQGKGSIGFGAKLPTKRSEGSTTASLKGLLTSDLTSYGLIPEFLGRLPIISTLHPLSNSDLVRILTEPKNALLKQYQAIFESYGAELKFTRKGIEAVAAEGSKRGGGARGLRGVLEEILGDAMFEVPGTSVRYCLVTESVVQKREDVLYFSRGQKFVMERRMDEDDGSTVTAEDFDDDAVGIRATG
ncbi:P-loop containing nucleoside triphosphate hydrolase protein [Kockovaella imperatae]|uniref:p-loop containing nucleoside triphosphate hydrolase protein n=1 Tax=Kockovaella imperatae TaxID=4999 RepID=A0A1Y1UA56_9TREE|nr:P-loop containing nucleoside triphosphate hydrolase protein [Kockovaella imperatae]ORX34931.1 P-loop containing nucleoside triphosphate hydrolase protein [Kockovaella imperatae]